MTIGGHHFFVCNIFVCFVYNFSKHFILNVKVSLTFQILFYKKILIISFCYVFLCFRLPVPDSIKSFKGINIDDHVDSTSRDGRIRTVPHQRGQWFAHIYSKSNSFNYL